MRVIAIDGPSGAGKSSVAKLLASAMEFNYLDTGALYRAVALALRRKCIEPDATDAFIGRALAGVSVSFRNGAVILDGEDVSGLIRTPEMGHFSSVFSARLPVREFLMPVQREAAFHQDLVAEGRDMTTVVFPTAWKKIYLDATVESRAMRRFLQLKDSGGVTHEAATADVVERDRRDSSRDIAPLRRAEDAHYIDSSALTLDETVSDALAYIGASK